MSDWKYYDRQDAKLSNFIIGYFFVQALNLLVKLVIGNFSLWSIISRGSLIILLIIALKPMLQKKLSTFLAIEIIFAILFSYTFLFGYASFDEYSSLVMNVFTVFVPMGIAMACVNDKTILLRRMYIMAWPTQIVLIMVLLSMKGYGYSMVCGYTLTFQMLIVFDHFCDKKKWYDLVACIIDAIFIVLYGSRGPILCIAAMILLKVFFSISLSKIKNWRFLY